MSVGTGYASTNTSVTLFQCHAGAVEYRADQSLDCRAEHLGSIINRDLNLLSSISPTASNGSGCRSIHPCKDCHRPKSPPPGDRRISKIETDRILQALYFHEDVELTARKQTGYAFLIALETAMRQGEIWDLDGSAIDFGSRYLNTV